jgi:hypothetical protein
MFLSKKNAVYFNKPKNIDPNRVKRVLAGITFNMQAGKTRRKRKSSNTILEKVWIRNKPNLQTSY